MAKRRDFYHVCSRHDACMVAADEIRFTPAGIVTGGASGSTVIDEWLIFVLDGEEVARWRMSTLLSWARQARLDSIT